MLTIPQRNDFQPDKDALEKWLATRKSDMSVTNTTSLPGFFSDSNITTDSNWVTFAIVIELLGVGLTWAGASKRGTSIFLIALFVVLLMVVLDVIFAIKLHRNVGKKTYIKSKKFVTPLTEAGIHNQLNLAAQEGNGLDTVIKIGICIIAIIKILAIVFFFRSVIWVRVVFAVLFAAVAYIHINYTGYWLAFLGVQKIVKKQHQMFNGIIHKAEIEETIFESPFKLRLPIRVNGHEIIEDIPHEVQENGKTVYKYNLKTTGILIDEDIKSFLSQQEGNQKLEIPKICREVQINMSPNLSPTT